MRTTCVALLCTAAVTAGAQQTGSDTDGARTVYTWVDKQGVTHYAGSAEEAAGQRGAERLELDTVDRLSVVDTVTPPADSVQTDSAAEVTAPAGTAAVDDELVTEARAADVRTGLPQPAGTDAERPQPQTVNGVRVLSGGVGDEAQDEMQRLQDEFNLHITFADDTGAYLAEVPLVIENDAGETLVDTVSRGPLFYAELDAGEYTVSTTMNGVEHKRTVSIDAGRTQEIMFKR